MSILLSVAIFLSAIPSAAVSPPWPTLLLAAVAILPASFYGGMRTTLTHDRITIRFGTPRYRVLRLNTEDVAEVALRSYMPLKEFGGYGIRANRHMSAYYLSGGRGVQLATREGKKRLIGSNHPQQLAEVIRIVARLEVTP